MSCLSYKNGAVRLIVILTLILASILAPRKSLVAFPVVESNPVVVEGTFVTRMSTFLSNYKETILDPLAYYSARGLIRQFTNSVVDWINSGFNGNPSFIQDPKKFLEDGLDRGIGEFIFGSELGFLCKPFELNVRLALGLQYSPFQDTINCRLSDVLKNIDGAYEDFVGGDFIGGGGWDSWLQITTVPQNNQIGAMLIAQSELDVRLNQQSILKNGELNWSGGFLSMKRCTRKTVTSYGQVVKTETFTGDSYTNPPPGPDPLASLSAVYQTGNQQITPLRQPDADAYHFEDDCETVTPGSWINDQLEKATGSDLTQLQLADEFNEIVGALVNYMATRIMSDAGGLLGQKNRNVANDEESWRRGIAELTAQQNANLNQGVANSQAPDTSGFSNGLNTLYTADINGNTQGGYTGNATIDTSKTLLQDYIKIALPTEQNFYLANNSIYNAAATSSEKYSDVIACYQTKIATPSNYNPPLTNNEITLANNEINTASSSLKTMNDIQTSVAYNVTTSRTNINELNRISTEVTAATTMEAVIASQTQLENLSRTLHGPEQVLAAQNNASTTINTIIAPSINIANEMQLECDIFPGRSINLE